MRSCQLWNKPICLQLTTKTKVHQIDKVNFREINKLKVSFIHRSFSSGGADPVKQKASQKGQEIKLFLLLLELKLIIWLNGSFKARLSDLRVWREVSKSASSVSRRLKRFHPLSYMGIMSRDAIKQDYSHLTFIRNGYFWKSGSVKGFHFLESF